jgi:hypothetical protein
LNIFRVIALVLVVFALLVATASARADTIGAAPQSAGQHISLQP